MFTHSMHIIMPVLTDLCLYLFVCLRVKTCDYDFNITCGLLDYNKTTHLQTIRHY